MTTDRWRQVEELFHAALERPEDARAAWLAEQDPDPAIRDEVLSLLAALRDQDRPAVARDSPPSSAAESESCAPLPAEHFGPWRVIRPLGRGGMGSVYLAERADGAFQMQAAVKLIGLPLVNRNAYAELSLTAGVMSNSASPQSNAPDVRS